MNPWPRAFARTRDVEHAHLVCHKPTQYLRHIQRLIEIDDQARPAIFGRMRKCELGTSCGLADGEDQRAVSVVDISPGPFGVGATFRLGERITRGYFAVLRPAPARAPTATLETYRDGKIEGGAIDTGLTARD